MAYTGQLYQLYSKSALHAGDYVAVNGPWDTYGTVLSSANDGSRGWLNQIRGCNERKGERPVATF